jgi:FG-GAP-like repeat
MYRFNGRFVFLSSIIFVSGMLMLLPGCDSFHRNRSHAQVPISSINEGKALAAVYCKTCHSLPDPSLLNATIWERGVLPAMGPRLGIFQHGFEEYPSNRFDMNLGPNFYPAAPVLTQQQWQHIIDYYTASSPDSLAAQQRKRAIRMDLPLFEVHTPGLTYKNAMASLVKINPAETKAPLIVSDAGLQKTFFLNQSLQPVDSVKTDGPIVDLQLFQNRILACNIGVLNPNNGAFGTATYIRKDENGNWKKDTGNLFGGLQRPVEVTAADLNNDGKTDYLVCEFGFLTGSLSWMENKGTKGFERHVLRPLPGAVKVYLQDYNHDGKMDFWVLFAQGEEGIFLYTNKGNGVFDAKEVLRFPPVYGSSYFELDDFNGDGHPDIVYTCGDNADFSPVLKPYHGVYIFMNKGDNTFNQKYFFPIHGCYKAIARDFDNDGDLDLATISFFADYEHQPEEGFVYLENKGNFDFQPYSIEAAKMGKWLTMDAGDIDGDGRIDLVLGNFCIGPSLSKSQYDWRKAPPFILLKNTGKKTLH